MKIGPYIREFIKINENLIKNYKLIVIIGSSSIKEDFKDIDFVTIGNDKNHQKFLFKLKEFLEARGFEISFFKSVMKRPEQKHNKHLLFHDLHYKDINDMLKKEWKDVINEIKVNCDVLYGSKKEIKLLKVKEKDFYNWWYKCSERINSEEEMQNFYDYLKRVIYYIKNIHPDLDLKLVYYSLLHILEQEKDWKKKKTEVEKFLRLNL